MLCWGNEVKIVELASGHTKAGGRGEAVAGEAIVESRSHRDKFPLGGAYYEVIQGLLERDLHNARPESIDELPCAAPCGYRESTKPSLHGPPQPSRRSGQPA